MIGETTNGLGELMPLANISVVGAGILIVVILSIWIVTKGIPRLIDRADAAQQRNEAAHAESRREFIAALDRQQQARSESAKAGHDAAMAIATNLRDLGQEIRRAYNGQLNGERIPTVRDWRNSLESGGT